MALILSQRIDYESDYKDVPFEVYHYPKRYCNQINKGDPFIYYQGDRHKRENRYYFGCGVIGELNPSEDGEHYYAKIINGIKFPKIVPIYNPDGGFFESIGYSEVRKKERPPWQSSIRKVSEEAFKNIINSSGINYEAVSGLFDIGTLELIKESERKVFRKLTSDFSEKELEDLMENATEQEIEKIISKLDGSGSLEVKQVFQKFRKASRKTTESLKELYNHSCQLCGANHFYPYGVNVIEAHHIEFFSKTQNHQPNNIIILCPSHHRLIHSGRAVFDRERNVFAYANGYEEVIKINKHL
jgi:hypothetical protein